jgi:RNA recognition motif-containing protein
VKGFALIKYADPSASWAALTMNGKSLYGKNITVELAKVDRD